MDSYRTFWVRVVRRSLPILCFALMVLYAILGCQNRTPVTASANDGLLAPLRPRPVVQYGYDVFATNRAVAFSPNGLLVAGGGDGDNRTCVFEAKSGRELYSLRG